MGWGKIFDVIDKLMPSRKASGVDRMNELRAELADAMAQGQNSRAEALRVQLRELREKLKITEGDL